MSFVNTLPVAFEPAIPLFKPPDSTAIPYHRQRSGVVCARDRDGNGRLARCTRRIGHRVNKRIG